LSGLVMTSLKLGSNAPKMKKTDRTPITPYPTALLTIRSRFQTTRMSETTASRKNSFGSAIALMTVLIKPIRGDPCNSEFRIQNSEPRPLLERTANTAVFSHAPEVHRHQHGNAEWQTDAVQHVKPQQRALTDERSAKERKPRI